jgi:hypothetical protein
MKTEMYIALEHVILPYAAPSGYAHQRHIYASGPFHGSISSSQIWPSIQEKTKACRILSKLACGF